MLKLPERNKPFIATNSHGQSIVKTVMAKFKQGKQHYQGDLTVVNSNGVTYLYLRDALTGVNYEIGKRYEKSTVLNNSTLRQATAGNLRLRRNICFYFR